jgi:hypothetical protein
MFYNMLLLELSSFGFSDGYVSWFRSYLTTEVKRLKVKVRKVYNRSRYRQNYEEELKRLSKELPLAKKKAQETFLRSVLQNVGRCWTELYKCVKRRRGNRENIPAIKDRNDKLVTEPVEKAKP